MRKAIFSILSGLMMALACWALPSGQKAKEDVIVPIRKGDTDSASIGRPHTPTDNLFEVWLDTDFGTLSVLMLSDVGEVDYTVVNFFTGESQTGSFDSATGTSIFVSGTSGLWRVTFTLESGAEYYGDFEL